MTENVKFTDNEIIIYNFVKFYGSINPADLERSEDYSFAEARIAIKSLVDKGYLRFNDSFDLECCKDLEEPVEEECCGGCNPCKCSEESVEESVEDDHLYLDLDTFTYSKFQDACNGLDLYKDCQSPESTQVLSDTHYRKMNIESIEVQEQIMESNTVIPDKPRHLICMGVKHVLRAGLKPGNDWKKEIRKAMNYFFRALTGKWLYESDLNDYFKNAD